MMVDDENDGQTGEPSVNQRDHLLLLSQSHRTGDEAIECDYEVLPVVDYRDEILTAVRNHQIVIVIGETGSGKTTQIPQFFLDDPDLLKCNQRIGVTQPRRIAAITIAQRVSDERSTTLGQEIGYTVRFDDCTSDSTRVKYMTGEISILILILQQHVH
jgi:HrpA-like RNA helicase